MKKFKTISTVMESNHAKNEGVWNDYKEKFKAGLKKNKEGAKKLAANIKTAISDIGTGEVLHDKESLTNLSNTLGDIIKVAGQGAFLTFIPGSMLALPALKKVLREKGPEVLGINKMLDLSFDVVKEHEDKSE